MKLKLRQNFKFDVNKQCSATRWVTLYIHNSFCCLLPFSKQSLRLMRAWNDSDEICAFPHLSAPASLSSSYLIHL